MIKIANPPRFDNDCPMPLFEAAEKARIRALSLPARRLARRHSLPASTALTIAELAGFYTGADR
jgi:hypothetical protein